MSKKTVSERLHQTLQKFRSTPEAPVPFEKATEQDVYYCYRLLLNKEPDEAGWQHFSRLVKNTNINIQFLVANFLQSAEFHQLHLELNTPKLIQLPEFSLYVRLNDFFIGKAIADSNTYEPHVKNEIEKWLKPGGVFVDVGANIGYFTLLAAQLVGQTGQVFAFEPNPNNCDLIQQSAEENKLTNINIFPNAVAETTVPFQYSAGGGSNGRILHESESGENLTLIEVRSVTLDETLAEVPQIDLIKMDIEGAEPRAWQGMKSVVKKHKPIIIFEFSPAAIEETSQTEPEQFLADLQSEYRLHIIQNRGSQRPQAANKQEIMQIVQGKHHLDLIGYPR